jgi:23S rRNA (adenine2030-N6)-methyltransferase
LNYRHAFHAGNFADLVKHAALLRVLARLMLTREPLEVIDTHAGRGMYDLAGVEARKSGEAAAAGVLRLMRERPPEVFAGLTSAVRGLNGAGEVRRYPGSPWLIAEALRPGDSYLACELRAEEHEALGVTLRGRPNVRTARGDGYEAALAAPAGKARRLLLIDPPFERPDDYGRIVEVLGRRRDAAALVWLPLKDLETFDGFLRDLEDATAAPLLVAETRMRPLTDPMKMNGCALVLAGPGVADDETLSADLDAICGWVAGTLGEGGSARVYGL